jgi:hypothetical protein
MINYQEEDYFTVIDEIINHLANLNDEAGQFEDFEIKPHWGAYDYLATAGAMRIYTARVEGNLVGFAAFFITPHHYYTDKLVAQSDVVYMVPEYRGKDSMELVKFSEDSLWKEDNIAAVNIAVSMKRDWSGMLQHLQYHKTCEVYTKEK